MKSIKPTNQGKPNNAKNVEKSNSSKTFHYLALREQVVRILANIAPTTKQRSDVD